MLESITHSKDYLYIIYSNGINNRIFKYNFKTKKIDEIALPYIGSASILCFDTKTNDCIVGITSWNKPYTEYDYNADKNIFTPSIFNKPPNYPAEYKDLVVEEVEVKEVALPPYS